VSRRSRAAISRYERDLDEAIRRNDPDLRAPARERLLAALADAAGDEDDDDEDARRYC
jgi:hypothetical protein